MRRTYEEDKLQCSAITDTKKRCNRIGTHSNGGAVLCERHHQMKVNSKEKAKPWVQTKS